MCVCPLTNARARACAASVRAAQPPRVPRHAARAARPVARAAPRRAARAGTRRRRPAAGGTNRHSLLWPMRDRGWLSPACAIPAGRGRARARGAHLGVSTCRVVPPRASATSRLQAAHVWRACCFRCCVPKTHRDPAHEGAMPHTPALVLRWHVVRRRPAAAGANRRTAVRQVCAVAVSNGASCAFYLIFFAQPRQRVLAPRVCASARSAQAWRARRFARRTSDADVAAAARTGRTRAPAGRARELRSGGRSSTPTENKKQSKAKPARCAHLCLRCTRRLFVNTHQAGCHNLEPTARRQRQSERASQTRDAPV
jgi:hypothetical protein